MRLGTAISVSVIAFAAFTAPAAAQSPCPGNPNALGLARTVEVDTTGGPGFGFEQYKAHDFLVLNEVVLTFDDGPWPGNTTAVLAALAHHCTKATFFPVGKHALWHPEILKQVAVAGHTIGAHTWSHVNLAKVKADKATEEIEKGGSVPSSWRSVLPHSILPLPVPAGYQGSARVPCIPKHCHLLA